MDQGAGEDQIGEVGQPEDETHAAIVLGGVHLHQTGAGVGEETLDHLEIGSRGIIAEDDRAALEHPHIGAEHGVKGDHPSAGRAQPSMTGPRWALRLHISATTPRGRSDPSSSRISGTDRHGHRHHDQIGIVRLRPATRSLRRGSRRTPGSTTRTRWPWPARKRPIQRPIPPLPPITTVSRASPA